MQMPAEVTTHMPEIGKSVEISTAEVRRFILSHSGKVKEIDLIDHFRDKLLDPERKEIAFEELRGILRRIASLRMDSGEKVLVLSRVGRGETYTKKSVKSLISQHELVLGLPLNVPGSRKSFHEQQPASDTDGESILERMSLDSGVHSERRSFYMHKSIDTLQSSECTDSHYGLLDNELLFSLKRIDPVERDWYRATSSCNLSTILSLLTQEPNLISRKDFFTGFTALHWAAKFDRVDIISKLFGQGVDVNARSNGGYTPLHLAAMYGRSNAVVFLVEVCDADTNIRNYSGKKAYMSMSPNLTAEARKLLDITGGTEPTPLSVGGSGAETIGALPSHRKDKKDRPVKSTLLRTFSSKEGKVKDDDVADHATSITSTLLPINLRRNYLSKKKAGPKLVVEVSPPLPITTERHSGATSPCVTLTPTAHTSDGHISSAHSSARQSLAEEDEEKQPAVVLSIKPYGTSTLV